MKLFTILKKADLILFAAILLSVLPVSLLTFSRTAAKESGQTVVIRQNGREYLRLNLNEDQIVDLGSNTVSVKNGTVSMSHADCKNQICVNTGAIRYPGQRIVCLPNRITVEITAEEGGLDAVTR